MPQDRGILKKMLSRSRWRCTRGGGRG